MLCWDMSWFPQMPAYAMIVMPLPGSYAADPDRFPPPQLLVVLLNVCKAPN